MKSVWFWASALIVLAPAFIALSPDLPLIGAPQHGYGWIVYLLPLIPILRFPERRKRHALYALGLLVQILAFPEPDLGFLGFFLLVPYLIAREQPDGAPWWRAAFFYGFFRAFVGYYWLGNILYTHWLFVSVLSALTFACVFEGILRKATFLPYALRAATAWAAFEWFHSWVGGGLPWLFLAHTQHRFLAFIQIADVVGTYAVSFLLAFLQAAALQAWARRRFRALAVAGTLCVASLVYGFARRVDQEPTGAGVLLVQTSVPLLLKVQEDFDFEEMLRDTVRLTRQGLESHPDAGLVVWPETMHPYAYVETGESARFGKTVRRYARIFGRSAIYGVNTYGSLERYTSRRGHNSAVLVGPEGGIGKIYRKRRLVPLGEHFLPRVIFPEKWCDGWIQWLMEHGYPANADLEEGEGFEVFDGGEGLRAAPLICFEGLYPDLTREAVAGGDPPPDFLLVLANFGWFQASWLQAQARAIWVFRAIETRTPFLVSANGGISCAVGPSGAVSGAVKGVMTEGFLYVPLVSRGPLPPYVRGGYALLPVGLIVAAALFLVRSYRRRRGVPDRGKDPLDSIGAFC
ncbi:MAG: apolipoprotein N-acyltransferase [Planctomycetota bacterium]|nr:apolipoprotein N-acyltransferase [Planctomycetota bacterium]